MPPLSRLGKQLEEVVAALNRIGARFALIGGLALASHKVVRATQDVDVLTEASKADEIHDALLQLGYRCLHRSREAGNYLRGDQRLDFLYASRPVARKLLFNALELDTAFGALHVVSTEGLDELFDSPHPLAAEGGVDVACAIGRDPYDALDDLMAVVEALCPRWPPRDTFEASSVWLL